jgi:uncharacterized membrane protein YphA (DoxX/SURF4 family)
MTIVIWIVQILLALAFVAHGLLFLNPPASLIEQLNSALPRWFQLFIGTAEVLAAVGLILPGVTRVLPSLVTWAAAGIMVVMVSATIFHTVRSEFSSAAATLALLAMATFVAYMRLRMRPILPRRRAIRGSPSA